MLRAEHYDLDCCLVRLGAACEGVGRLGPWRLLRGVLDMPLAAANDGGGARRVCWRAEEADGFAAATGLRASRVERGTLQWMHWDLHLLDATSQIEKNETNQKVCER